MRTSLVARGMAAVMAATGLGMVTLPPASASPVLEGGCTVYGRVVEAPDGFIPRDDMMRQRRDPLAKWVAEHPRKVARAVAADATVRVPVAFHVIRKNATVEGGNVPRTWITRQMNVLNDSFGGRTGGANTGFQFVLKEVDRTTKPQWFNLISAQGGEPRFYRGSGKEIKMKKALHQGGAETLNVYTAKLGQFLLGWAYYPSSFAGRDPLPRFFDGVVVDFRSLPNAGFEPYNEGDTVTHEVGHWLQLAHTFENGCLVPGDYVVDTPYEASPAFGCPEGRDTCESDPGLDPVENFMDYTYDACMHVFTPGQARRAQEAWTAFRQ